MVQRPQIAKKKKKAFKVIANILKEIILKYFKLRSKGKNFLGECKRNYLKIFLQN